ncbi:MAG: OmpA family protein [Candidatus Sulfotelmatobacter sp.]|jgi:outer membrane protein OmpA-like peptidoglycan-associated protein
MKIRSLATLLLTAALAFALPAFAQQNSTSTAQPAASTDQSAAQPAPRQDFWDGDEPGVGWLILHPFASKEYVRRHVEPIRNQLNELEELTASSAKATRDVDSRAQQGIQMVSAKTSLADEHAQDAANKAQMAHQTVASLDTRLATDQTVISNIDQFKSAQQTEIRFRPGQTVLSKQAKDALDEMAAPLKGQHGYVIEVEGFSSGQGQAAIASSRKMADSVERYLVLNHEIPAYRIYVIGMGNVPTAQHATGTRVEVSVMKNDLDQTAKQ